jgi:hypothetical protein
MECLSGRVSESSGAQGKSGMLGRSLAFLAAVALSAGSALGLEASKRLSTASVDLSRGLSPFSLARSPSVGNRPIDDPSGEDPSPRRRGRSP